MILLPKPPRCAFPSCTDWGVHEHHITYDPPVTKRLCFRHHEEITIINGQQARKYRRTLSNRHRWWAWYQWTNGNLKARRTRRALEYTEAWSADTGSSTEETQTLLAGKREADLNDATPAKGLSKPQKRKVRSGHQPERRTVKRKKTRRKKPARKKAVR